MASERWGGAEKVFVQLANGLSINNEVYALLLRGTDYAWRFAPAVNIIELTSHPTTHNPFLVLEILNILKDLRPDLVHTHAVKATLLMWRAGRFLSLTHVATKHNARKGKIFSRLQWVTVVSEDGRKSIVPQKSTAVIKVIHNGIAPLPVEGQPPGSPFCITAVGRLDAIKGFDVLIDQVCGLPFPFLLHIVGEGPEHDALMAHIRRNNLESRVRLSGFCEDVPQRMKSSHLVVISSLSEGFPQVMVESLFYANVLISTPVGGVNEVLPDLFLADQHTLGDKIEDVYTRYNHYCSEFARVQRQKADDFVLSGIIEKYQSYYREILT